MISLSVFLSAAIGCSLIIQVDLKQALQSSKDPWIFQLNDTILVRKLQFSWFNLPC